MKSHAPHPLFTDRTLCGIMGRIVKTNENKFVLSLGNNDKFVCDQYSRLSELSELYIDCAACLEKLTPGSSLYKDSVGCKRYISPSAAIITALKAVDSYRRLGSGHHVSELQFEIVNLLERENLHVSEGTCTNCNGQGTIPHTHGVYCYRESWGGDELICGSSHNTCDTCKGLGKLSEKLLLIK